MKSWVATCGSEQERSALRVLSTPPGRLASVPEQEVVMTGRRGQRGPRLSIEQVKHAAAKMRLIDILDIFATGSGHPGGTPSIIHGGP